jgi:TolB-like protein
VAELRAARSPVALGPPIPPRTVVQSERAPQRPKALATAPAAQASPPDLTSFASARRRSRISIMAIAGVVVIGIVVATVARVGDRANLAAHRVTLASVVTDPRPSIAVLPFKPISADSNAVFIADGVTEMLRNALDRRKTLRVMSRMSASAAGKQSSDVADVAQRLHVRYVVEGSVRLSGREMRIVARLVDATTGAVLLSENYDRQYATRSIIGIEDTIAVSIADRLNVRLTEGSRVSLAGWAPNNPAALEPYLWGRHFWATRNPDGVRKSIRYFHDAIHADSTFAPAFSGLADTYAAFAIGNMADLDAGEYFRNARIAAEHALALDSTLAEAHASLGYFYLLHNLDWPNADVEISKAIELNQSYAPAHLYRAVLFEWTGRFEDAVTEARIALEYDPLAPASSIELGRALFFAHRYAEADRQLRLALDKDSTSFRARLTLAQVLQQERRFEEAIREFERTAREVDGSSRPIALLANAYAAAGKGGEAKHLLDSLYARKRVRYVPAFDFAIVYAGLRQPADVSTWLTASIQDHSIRPFLMDPTFDAVRGDARVQTILNSLSVPVLMPRS